MNKMICPFIHQCKPLPLYEFKRRTLNQVYSLDGAIPFMYHTGGSRSAVSDVRPKGCKKCGEYPCLIFNKL